MAHCIALVGNYYMLTHLCLKMDPETSVGLLESMQSGGI